jgi:hypothetical protein
LEGIWADLGVKFSQEGIAEARREMGGTSPATSNPELGRLRHAFSRLVLQRLCETIRNGRRGVPDAAVGGDSIFLPSICLVELTYLTERVRVPVEAMKRLRESVDDPAP